MISDASRNSNGSESIFDMFPRIKTDCIAAFFHGVDHCIESFAMNAPVAFIGASQRAVLFSEENFFTLRTPFHNHTICEPEIVHQGPNRKPSVSDRSVDPSIRVIAKNMPRR